MMHRLVRASTIAAESFASPVSDQVRFCGYVADRLRWELRGPHGPIKLSPRGFDVLFYLIDHRERVVSKDELLEKIWSGRIVEENNLSQHIFMIRKALSQHDPEAQIIDTVPRRGYRFVAELEPTVPREQHAPALNGSALRHPPVLVAPLARPNHVQ